MDLSRVPSTKEKALSLNLDRTIYGSFAEIGAGQETAANFFKVGSASGTIAKTMSAYDMNFSDAIYGKTKRYVSKEKLQLMLEHEMELLQERLPERAETTKFFVFANTVEILNYHRTNQGHGWMGIRFQREPQAPVNECVIHVLLHDKEAAWQQQALGVLGVNMVYACTHEDDPVVLMQSLLDNLSTERLEIDFFRIKGPSFARVDNRLMALKLVKNGLTHATMFDANGTVLQPSEALYKKDVLILRGRFRPLTHVNMDMLKSGLNAFMNEPEVVSDRVMLISELTLNNLVQEKEEISDTDFLHRVDILESLGQKVMISDYQKYYKLTSYISKITQGKIGIILGVASLQKLFDETYYQELTGGILEAFGNLFKNNVKLFVYPSYRPNSHDIFTHAELSLSSHLTHLYKYLYETHRISGLEPINAKHLDIISDDVLQMIREGVQDWEQKVPDKVWKAIKDKKLFDYSEGV
jgi:hypothetical protein